MSREIERRRRAAAEKLEFERRTAQELEIAKQVQARLFPQTLPALNSLDYAGVCIQARHVGGDYYDFLALGQERLGLLIGDISGKGIAAALLMANLQANLRSQFTLAREQPHLLLRSVNDLFYKNTAESSYATFFFAEYDGTRGSLRYANCGHLSALLLRDDRSLEWLHSTSTVLGLFPEWDGPTKECQLRSGDTLALYTDGVTESFNEHEEEFGETRLVEALLRHHEQPAHAVVSSIVDELQSFSKEEQHEDITLIVAKCRG
jgi:serine phosphatase RsbU (regulator of sigma subunit)